MCLSLCGLDCSQCPLQENCAGCAATHGRPFGGECMLAACCADRGIKSCSQCSSKAPCALEARLIEEFNALGIEDMPKVTSLNALKGSFVNLEYLFPGGQRSKLWDDNRIYLGNQLPKADGRRCYGLAADERFLCVCEYGADGKDPEIVVFKRRK